MTGERRVFVLVLRRDGAGWRGRIKDNPAEAVTGADRAVVVRTLEALALAQLTVPSLYNAGAPAP